MNLVKNRLRILIPLFIVGVALFSTQSLWAGVEIEGSMNTSRLIKMGANECYDNVNDITSGDYVKLLGRNADGSWVFIWADAGDGWVPTSTVNPNSNIFALSVWNDHFAAVSRCAAAAATAAGSTAPAVTDSRICGREGAVSSGQTSRWTHVYTTADPELKTDQSFAPGTTVNIIGRDFWGCWLAIGNGQWLPADAIDTRETLGHPILIDNSDGCSIANAAVSCPDA